MHCTSFSVEIGEELAEDIEKDDFDSQRYTKSVRNVMQDVDLEGDVERVHEDSS